MITPDPSPDRPTIPGYDRLREIGRGGFSVVYEAYQTEFRRRVAVKVLNVESTARFDRGAFEDECQAMGMVSEHPNIVTVFASGFTGEGAPYIAMERYQETLLDRIRAAGFLPYDQVLELGVKLCGALHRAHGAGLLHRDVKPQNIFYSKYGEPVLGDFGIAALAANRSGNARFGFTPSYAAPEVIEGLQPTVEADLYSLGATLYTALAGRRPFARADDEPEDNFFTRIRAQAPPEITSQQLPEPVRRIVVGLLAKHPQDRPRRALDVAGLLREAQVHLGMPATPLVLPAAGAADDELTTTVARAAPDLQPRHPAQLPSPADDLTSATVAGRQQIPDQVAAAGPSRGGGGGRRRVWYAAAALVATLGVGGIGAALATRTDDRSAEPGGTLANATPTTVVVADESPLVAPAQVTVTAGRAESVQIAWGGVDAATGYRVEFVSESRQPEVVAASPFELPSEGISTPVCVQVRAIGEGGRLSPASATACGPGS